ncbi:MAG: SusD/RagB family nutrient-binding outer membrane lipoprotein [Bacteroidales bacterium]|nr:SusD/RagB family nutrient-binding outer membrane lipoprotein [Bacteroidales bacterium]
MKKILSILFSLVLLFGLSSCAQWLDVNTDPDSPSNQSATVENRLPWIQYYYMYAWGTANTRTSAVTQMVTTTSRTAAVGLQANWNPAQGIATTVYQNFFLGAACNIVDLLEKAEKEGAYHYMGAALAIKSMGFLMMVDLYGEMPYTDAVGANYAPYYDNGDVIYHGCLEDLDKAIEYFKMTQEDGATQLSAGDAWCGGDPNAWIRLCHGLKARYLNNLTKTGEFNADAVLAELEQGPTANDQNVIMRHYNVATAGTCFTVGDAYGPNTTWDSFAWGGGQRLNRYYVNLLTNYKGTGVEDPRANKLIPSGMYKVSLNADGSIRSYQWLRDCGLDNQNKDEYMTKDRVTFGNLNTYLSLASSDVKKTYTNTNILAYYPSVDDFLTAVHRYYSDDNVTVEVGSDDVSITYHPGAMYVNDTNPLYIEDIKYINVKADALFETYGLAENDENTYYCNGAHGTRSPAGQIGFVVGTGTFYARPTSNSYIMTYPEMCFIKAEVLFNKGDRNGAYTAYTNGIRAHFELMNQKLAEWQGAGYCTTAKGFDVSFAYAPIPQNEIDAYMRSAAVKQSAGELTLSDIMMQKYIAMGPDMQKWNDVRKYNYFRDGIYTEMSAPVYRNDNATGFSANPSQQTYYPRRWMQSTHETNYNSKNVNAIYEQYAGYVNFSKKDPALSQEVNAIPVWWDMEK